MPCKCCYNLEKIAEIREKIGPAIELNCCPVCGSDLNIARFSLSMKDGVEEEFRKLYATAYIKRERRNETVEIDGEILPVVHVPTPMDKPVSKPLDLAVDLDKIDITREMAMLQEKWGGDIPWKST